jgi:hypothetical protein
MLLLIPDFGVGLMKFYLVSACDFIPHCKSVTVGEAIACLEGLKLALPNSSSNLVIRGECMYIFRLSTKNDILQKK